MLIRNIETTEKSLVAMDGASGVTMAVLVGRGDGAPTFAMRAFEVEPGGHTPRHSHDYEHEVMVTGGAGTVLLEGAERPITSGDVIYVPADEEHQFKQSGSEPLKFVCLVPVERNCGEPTPGSE
ncbi:MAG: cupin domain-containing protein [Planctomycetota bacterium]